MRVLRYILATTVLLGFLTSCEEYLEPNLPNQITEEDIFASYLDYQGFVDHAYNLMVDYGADFVGTGNLGGEVFNIDNKSSVTASVFGNYYYFTNGLNRQSIFYDDNGGARGKDKRGVWSWSWEGIRIANQAIEKIGLLNASDFEKDLILGQAYFLRAFFHFEVIRAFGPMPYITRSFIGSDEVREDRYIAYKGKEGWQANAEYISEDLERAADLLPVRWEDGMGGLTIRATEGRATKGAAYAVLAKAMLYAGSPLMNQFSGGAAEVDTEYMERAAAAAWEVMKLDQFIGGSEAPYALQHFDDYYDMFYRVSSDVPWTNETIIAKPFPFEVSIQPGLLFFRSRLQQNYTPANRAYGVQACETPTQDFIDLFEMADGTRYDASFDTDPTKRWENRDPRLRKSVFVNGDKIGTASSTTLELFDGGQDEQELATCYLVKKYWAPGVNSQENQFQQYKYLTPILRLAEIYLIYAEAVAEAYGANGSHPNASGYTAVDAVNRIREREGLGMPPIDANASGYDDFIDLVLNERAVELCFEGDYWFDVRRRFNWDELGDELFTLEFNEAEDASSFRRVKVANRIYDTQHNWLPLPFQESIISEGFYQNPGW